MLRLCLLRCPFALAAVWPALCMGTQGGVLGLLLPSAPPIFVSRILSSLRPDFHKISRATAGFTGAQLMNLMNQSGD